MDFCRLNACFGVSRSYCMGVLAFVWGTEAYNGEICDFFKKKLMVELFLCGFLHLLHS